MKPLTLLVAIFISTMALGQDNQKPIVSKEFNRILFGVNVSADYCYRTLKNNDGSEVSNELTDILNKNDQPKMGYTAGLNMCNNFSKHIGIEVGLQYSNKGYAFQQSDLTFSNNIDPRYGFVYNSNGSALPSQIKLIYNYIYLDIPISAIFRFGEKRIQFITSIGITTNILLNTTVKSVVTYDDSTVKNQTNKLNYDFNKLNISPTISAGINYKISSKMNISVAPAFRYGILKIIDAPITAYLWSAGLNVTCYYAIK